MIAQTLRGAAFGFTLAILLVFYFPISPDATATFLWIGASATGLNAFLRIIPKKEVQE